MISTEAPPTLLIVGPVPPPVFGVAKATELMLESVVLARHFRVCHVDTSDTRGFSKMGRLGLRNIRLGLQHVGRLTQALVRERPELMLLTISQGRYALLRDALFVLQGRLFHAQVVSYLRGSGYATMRARQGWIAARVLGWVLRKSSRVIVLGSSLVPMARSACPSARVAAVPNGCPPAVRPSEVGRRDEDHPLLLYVGRLANAKGLDEALLAARRIVQSCPRLEFVACGEWDSPSYQREIMSLTAELGLSQVVRFPGPVTGNQKEVLMSRAWVLVVPSHSEGQPWVILEALSAGLPVVATDTGAVSETLTDGVCGFVVGVGDHASLAARTVQLMLDEGLWRSMSENCVSRYLTSFSVERSHEILATELERVLQDP